VRAATEASVAAVRRIEQTISAIDQISGSIAAAVEQQGAATAEITRNVAETASSVGAVTHRICEVSAEAQQTDQHALAVQDDATKLEAVIADLSRAVIRVVRTSTIEVNRRAAPRSVIELPCRVRVGSTVQNTCLTDLSTDGACIKNGPQIAVGARGSLEASELGGSISFLVVDSGDGSLHVRFEQDVASVGTYLERLGRKQAA
jgi:hypothetical protein